MSDKKTYKEKNGTSKVGDFLRSLNLKENLPNILGAGFDIATGDFKGAIENFVVKSSELTPEQRLHALELLKSDVAEQQEITKRWESDNKTDSVLTRNIRPVTLAFLTLALFLFIILDSCDIGFEVETTWIDLLKSLLLTVFVAYFGGRSYEKSKKL
jgi:hypothetical protein